MPDPSFEVSTSVLQGVGSSGHILQTPGQMSRKNDRGDISFCGRSFSRTWRWLALINRAYSSHQGCTQICTW